MNLLEFLYIVVEICEMISTFISRKIQAEYIRKLSVEIINRTYRKNKKIQNIRDH